MYVIVGIASYNEADSIAGVVRVAGQGLRLLAREFPDLRALILNADSQRSFDRLLRFCVTSIHM